MTAISLRDEIGGAGLPPVPLRFSEGQIRRYSRQMVVAEFGGPGQARLLAARVLVVGVGGLGSPAALYLAAAGIGTLGLLDAEAVELSNLQRQILHGIKDLGRSKAASGSDRVKELNPDVEVVPHDVRLDASTACELAAGYDVVLEGSDDLTTKLIVNDACVALGRPLVVAGALRWEGQLLVVKPGETPCYRCVVRGAPPAESLPSCDATGIVGPVAGVTGCLQAVEALKLCLGLPSRTLGRLLLYDGLTGEIELVAARPDPACPACGGSASPRATAAG